MAHLWDVAVMQDDETVKMVSVEATECELRRQMSDTEISSTTKRTNK